MKRALILLLLAVSFGSTAATNNTTLKIGVINVRDVLQKATQADEINKSLEKEFLPKKNSIIATQKSLKDKNEKYQRDAEVMSDAERKKTEKELLEKQRDLQRMETEYREDSQVRQREETEKLLSKVSDVMNKLAKEDNYDLILHKEAAPYANADFDITAKVLERLNAKK